MELQVKGANALTVSEATFGREFNESLVHQVVVDQNQQNLDEKNCWVCFASEEDDPSASWTHPCK